MIQMDDDSFEIESHQQYFHDSEAEPMDQPRPIPFKKSPKNDYELTFKKQFGKPMKEHWPPMPSQQLFDSTCPNNKVHEIMHMPTHQLINKVRHNQLSMQFLLEIMNQNKVVYEKVTVVRLSMSIKQLWRKQKSAVVNRELLEIKDNKSEEQKHKLYLLKLLITQLHKKIFVESVKFQFWRKRACDAPQQVDSPKPVQYEDSFDDLSQNPTQLMQQQQQSQISYHNQEEENPYYSKPKLTIFMQICKSYCYRIIYSVFYTLKQLEQPEPPLESEEPTEQDFDNMDREERIVSIVNYIQELKMEVVSVPKSNKQILKNYFIKWKVHFLTNMMRLIREDPHLQTHSEPEYNGDNFTSISEVTENGNLKQEKKTLKQFLRHSECGLFLSLLRENYSEKKIRKIGRTLYYQSLVKKSFIALLENVQERKEEAYIQEYAEKVAREQSGDPVASKIFHRTNLVAKSFLALKNFHRCQKFAHTITKLFYRVIVRQTSMQQNQSQRTSQMVERYIQRKKKMLMWKIFNSMKNKTSTNNYSNQKLQRFLFRKQREMVQFYFKIMSLGVKRNLVLMKKAETYHRYKTCKKYFESIKNHAEQQQKSRNKQKQLQYLGKQWMKRKYMKRLIDGYLECLKKQKIEIKQEKLSLFIWKKRLRGFFSEWRKGVIHVKSYDVIEMKLKKLKQHETKMMIWRRWRERLEQRKQSQSEGGSDKHKSWLLNYYESLCSIDK